MHTQICPYCQPGSRGVCRSDSHALSAPNIDCYQAWFNMYTHSTSVCLIPLQDAQKIDLLYFHNQMPYVLIVWLCDLTILSHTTNCKTQSTLFSYHFLCFFDIELGTYSNLFLSLASSLKLSFHTNNVTEESWHLGSPGPESLEASLMIGAGLHACISLQQSIIEAGRGEVAYCSVL